MHAGNTTEVKEDAALFASGDPEQVRKTQWFYGYKTAVKAVIKLEMQGFDGILVLVCVEGGPVTQVEAEEMVTIVNEARKDAAKSHLKVRIQLITISYYDFLQEYGQRGTWSDARVVYNEGKEKLDEEADEKEYAKKANQNAEKAVKEATEEAEKMAGSKVAKKTPRELLLDCSDDGNRWWGWPEPFGRASEREFQEAGPHARMHACIEKAN